MKKTVFIIGAGASKDLGLPLGMELQKDISKHIHIKVDQDDNFTGGDHTIYKIIKDRSQSFDDFDKTIDVCRSISEAMPLNKSIDNYVNIHKANEEIVYFSKLIIAAEILWAENDFIKKFNHTSFHNFKDTWQVMFFKELFENRSLSEVENTLKSITFIIFNYDRCFEYLLHEALKLHFSPYISDFKVAEIINELDIIHPYGQVGFLPWSKSHDKVEMGLIPNEKNLSGIASKLKTFSEGVNELDISNRIRMPFTQAQTIYFLGFSYHPLNIDTLFGNMKSKNNVKILGTGFGLSKDFCEKTEVDLKSKFGPGTSVSISNKLTCSSLFEESLVNF